MKMGDGEIVGKSTSQKIFNIMDKSLFQLKKIRQFF